MFAFKASGLIASRDFHEKANRVQLLDVFVLTQKLR